MTCSIPLRTVDVSESKSHRLQFEAVLEKQISVSVDLIDEPQLAAAVG
jgi:hypothetical protein